jgi:TetR/AcrR family transcriptional regulator, repressor for neighboring sulfatase
MKPKKKPKTKRLRRTPEAVRSAALQAARTLLLKAGPESITLPAVAKELDMAHGNITHHFGSVGALHALLVEQMGQEFAAAVQSAVAQLRDENADPVDVVDAIFDAFNDTGAGRLISWLASTNNMAALEPWFATVAAAVKELSKGVPKPGEHRQTSVRQTALVLLSTALGNALIGDRLHAAVGLPKGTLNELSAKDLVRRAYPDKKQTSSGK